MNEFDQYTEDQAVMKSKTKHPFWRLLKYGKPHIGWFLIALIIISITVGLELMQPRILGNAVDNFVVKKDGQGVLRMGLLYLATVVGEFGLTYLQAMILAMVGQKIIFKLREDLFGHLTKLHIGFFNDNPVGRLVTRVTNDCETVNELFTAVIVNIIKGVFILAGVMGSMLMYNVRLSLYIFLVIPFIIAGTWVFTVATRKIYRKVRALISDINAFVAERIIGIQVVQTFTAESDVENDFRERTETLRKTNMRQIMAFAFYSPVSYVANISALGILIYFGGHMAIQGAVTIGTLVAFQRYISKFFQPIQELAEEFNVIQSANACAERIFWLLDTEPEIVDAEDAVHMEHLKGEIEFKNVWFAYKMKSGEAAGPIPEDTNVRDANSELSDSNNAINENVKYGDDEYEWVLRDVSFKVAPGESVAFVGATGAGKTTIQNLICRYYDIQKGQILIDGVDVRKIKLDDLRGHIGEMLQDVFLFSGTVEDNIRLNEKPESSNEENSGTGEKKDKDDENMAGISDDEIRLAAETVNASTFIEALPNGYKHEVIERGASFSAGQRQLLSFARTLAFKPDVLILDEATANIDTETEILIQDALGKLMKGRTTLIVAHRLSTIRNVDNIIVMHKGEIVEQGDHQSLLSNHGIYYKLYKLQYEDVA